MGKGGEKSVKSSSKPLKDDAVNSKAVASEASSKLNKLTITQLKDWASLYGVALTDDRNSLIASLDPYADGILDVDRPSTNLPLAPPKFTLKEIRDAIPSHCFKRSLVNSLIYLAIDMVLIAIIFKLGTLISHPAVPAALRPLLWPIYWYCQGSVFTGIWVLAHECGHQAFSDSELVNNTFGSILHSLLLVPYHSWRITHGKHHSNTGSTDNDEVFCPSTRSDFKDDMLRETPLAHLFGVVMMLVVGWMPGYLFFNATGPKKYKDKPHSHFNPNAAFFKPEDYSLIVQTDICFILAVSLLVYSIYTFGFINVGTFYIIPYMITNYHLVLITYLQHTDVFMPHFRGKEWNWLRGALCTVDRSFGPILDYCFHHIVDTHVCHHLFSTMPFYHAQEATEAIKKVLGPYYLHDSTPIAKALWRSYTCCQFIEDEGGCVFYKNKL